jgi:hypothetical protein
MQEVFEDTSVTHKMSDWHGSSCSGSLLALLTQQ